MVAVGNHLGCHFVKRVEVKKKEGKGGENQFSEANEVLFIIL